MSQTLHGAARRRAVQRRAELGKAQPAALVLAAVEKQRDGEATVCGALGGVVAVRAEEAAGVGVVAGDQIALDARRLVLERLEQLRNEATDDALTHLGLEVAAPLELLPQQGLKHGLLGRTAGRAICGRSRHGVGTRPDLGADRPVGEAAREAVVVGIGVGVVSAAEFGADARVCALPIVDCQRHLTETLVCLSEQRTRRVVATFLDIMRESLQPGASSKNALTCAAWWATASSLRC